MLLLHPKTMTDYTEFIDWLILKSKCVLLFIFYDPFFESLHLSYRYYSYYKCG